MKKLKLWLKLMAFCCGLGIATSGYAKEISNQQVMNMLKSLDYSEIKMVNEKDDIIAFKNKENLTFLLKNSPVALTLTMNVANCQKVSTEKLNVINGSDMSLNTGVAVVSTDKGVVFARTNLYLNKTIDKTNIDFLVYMLALYGKLHHNESEYCQ